MAFNWTCPFCDRAQTVTDNQIAIEGVGLPLQDNKYGWIGAQIVAIACANTDCQEVTIRVGVNTLRENPGYINYSSRSNYNDYANDAFLNVQIKPDSSYKSQPDFIPEPLREDYYEACLIRTKSPKASATLARRCLQGMIRDFCGISKARLIDEIKYLKAQVDNGTAPAGVTPETIDAIDSVRSVGNIGAHMEKDINVIVEVGANEAKLLIGLIELLFEDWYVARNSRRERLAKVTALADTKKAELEAAKIAALPKPSTP